MNPLKSIMKPALRLLPWLGLAALTGCSWEEDPATCLPETTSLQVTVSARQEGDLNSRADENAKPGEFMNDLCVLFVQNNVVKLKLQPDLSNDASATAGNLENWTSGEQFLEAGTYTVYAFANLSENYYSKWGIGTILSGDALPENIVLNDPAGELNSGTRQYIPMAAKETVEITAATRSVSIGLDRLVAKVRMTVSTTSQESVTVKNVTFSGYADKVSLIKDASLSSVNRDQSYSYDTGFLISNGNPEDIPEFYVNETRPRAPFSISVTTDENQGVTYLATTTRTDLPRNSIYPLTLNLNDSELELTPVAYLQVTGVPAYDVEYDVDEANGVYTFGITNGSYLTIEPTIRGAKETPQFTWDVSPNNPAGIGFLDKEEAESVGLPQLAESGLLCNISAGYEYDNKRYMLTLHAVWTGNDDHEYNRTYNIIVETSQDYDTVFDGIIDNLNLMTQLGRNTCLVLTTERLYMHKTK